MNLTRKIGEKIEDVAPREFPGKEGFKGTYVELHRVDPKQQAGDLFAASHGNAEKEAIWTYIPMSGPFDNQQHMVEWLRWCRDHPDFTFYAVYGHTKKKYVGMTSFVSIVPDMQRLELGFIWYAPEAQRSEVNTESIYLMLCEAFDHLKYRRVEWKCDSLNQPSRNAALRLGFCFEGVFRKHMIINGHNRDTAWFAMIDTDWVTVKPVVERWLYGSERYFSLREAIQERSD